MAEPAIEKRHVPVQGVYHFATGPFSAPAHIAVGPPPLPLAAHHIPVPAPALPVPIIPPPHVVRVPVPVPFVVRYVFMCTLTFCFHEF
jgi:hypothetical protein